MAHLGNLSLKDLVGSPLKALRQIFNRGPIENVARKIAAINKKYELNLEQNAYLDEHRQKFQTEYSDLQLRYIAAEHEYLKDQLAKGLLKRKNA